MGNSSIEQIERITRRGIYALLGFKMHRGQEEIDDCRKRMVICAIGRQFGKSMWLAHRYIAEAAVAPPNSIIWHVAPQYDLAKPVFCEHFLPAARKLRELNREFYITGYSERDLIAKFSNGVMVQCKTADNQGSLQGRKLWRLGIDEASSIRDPLVWEQYLRPTLAVSEGRCWMISTPKGRNWFWECFCRGQDDTESDWASFQMPSSVNPYLPAAEIENARRTLPERVFRQEWLAEFIEDASSVFRGVLECIQPGMAEDRYGSGEYEQPIPGRLYVGGLDLAKHEDFSVLTLIDSQTRRVVYFGRWREVDWQRQIASFARVCEKYNRARVLIDSTGVGEPVFEYIKKNGIWCEPYNFCGNRKFDLINALAISIENRAITFPRIEVLLNELLSFEYTTTKGGLLRMSAPRRQHDDAVISLALANWMLERGSGRVATKHRGRYR